MTIKVKATVMDFWVSLKELLKLLLRSKKYNTLFSTVLW